jgi:hypothetical protein
MEQFEKKLAQATAEPNPQILGVIATVIGRDGTPLLSIPFPCRLTHTGKSLHHQAAGS